MSATQPLSVVDAFVTDAPFSGNPAGVLLLADTAEAGWMQAVASQLNLSETAFARRAPGGGWSLRWFTPVAEVALCGHATLAVAHVLWEEGHLAGHEEARFETVSGPLTVSRDGGGVFAMDFPSLPAARIEPHEGLTRALGYPPPLFVGQTSHEDDKETNYLVELPGEEEMRTLDVDLPALAALPAGGLIVTSPSVEPAFDFVSRYFAPAAGLPEDPVTGSAHCTLGPFWGERLGKRDLRALQASRRGGILDVRVEDGRVRLAGRARTVIRGELYATAQG